MCSVRNVDANVRTVELALIPEQLEVLHHHRWLRNFYEAP